jgi:hypothetical protein
MIHLRRRLIQWTDGCTVAQSHSSSTRSPPSLQKILFLALSVRLLVWLLMVTWDVLIPDHNPGVDVWRFPLRFHDDDRNCFALSGTFCDQCGRSCTWNDVNITDSSGSACVSIAAVLSSLSSTTDSSEFPKSLNLIQQHIYPLLLRPLTRWDSARFLSLALKPQLYHPHMNITFQSQHTSEEFHAFLPLYPFMIQYTAQILMRCLPLCLWPATCEGFLVLAAKLLNIACFLIATCTLYYTTLFQLPLSFAASHSPHVSSSASLSHQSHKWARRAAVLFVFNPAQVFFTAAYSESLAAAFMFSGCALWSYMPTYATPDSSNTNSTISKLHSYFVTCRHSILSHGSKIGAMFLWMGAIATRSNAMVYAGFVCLYGLGRLMIPVRTPRRDQQSDSSVVTRVPLRVFPLVGTLLAIGVMLYPLRRHNQLGWQYHCDTELLGSVTRADWCDYVSYLYSHVQRQYWNVGLFRYYEWKQLPQFLLATPVLSVALLGIAQWIQATWYQCQDRHVREWEKTYGNIHLWHVYVYARYTLADFATAHASQTTTRTTLSSSSSRQQRPISQIHVSDRDARRFWQTSPLLLGHYSVLAATAFLGLTIAHVQISTRMIASSCPAWYWTLAMYIFDTGSSDEDASSSRVARGRWEWGDVLLLYCLVFTVVGTALHANFLPWT